MITGLQAAYTGSEERRAIMLAELRARLPRLILVLFDELNERGRTIIMVTHEDHVSAHAERVVRLRDGQIESDRPQVPARRRP